ncbi:MAG: bifunctional precorrin-2 dehydrogenase/sirohydrochlorin ferrochelatase [Candidatus Heimdallarchaeota archaeon]
MSFLSINYRLKGPVVLFGFGKVGQRKYHALKNIAPHIIVIDSAPLPDGWPQIAAHKYVKMKIKSDNFQKIIPRDTALVIVALSDTFLSKEIAEYCHQSRTLVNVVDKPDLCSVFFPAVLRHEDLSIAISTNGKCPFYAKHLKNEFLKDLKRYGEECKLMTELRVVSSNPKRDLDRVIQDTLFFQLLEQQNYPGALQRGRKIIGAI